MSGRGWVGKTLVVDLTSRKTEVIPTADYADRFVGGIGLAAKMIWDRMDLSAGALDPGNWLVLATGPLTGTTAPGAGRFELMGKSPALWPREMVTRSGLGGLFGPELKFAGFDALALHGAADAPVRIHVEDGKAEILDAADLVGLDAWATQQAVIGRHDPETKVLAIGKTGEKRCRFSAIVYETGFVSGKSGFGAVMGSKNLKAVSARGRGGVGVARPGELMELADHIRRLTSRNPMKEWTTGYVPPAFRREFFRRHRTRNTGCFGCPHPCFAFAKVPDVGNCQIHCIMYFYEVMAEAWRQDPDEWCAAFWESVVSMNREGVCGFEMLGIVRMLHDLHEKGLISEKDTGLPFGEFGSRAFFRTLMDMIVERRGFGDILAEGAPRAAETIEGAWPVYERHHPAHGESEHDSVRKYPAIALLWALDTRDPLIDHHAYRHLSVSRKGWPAPHVLSLGEADRVAEKVFGSAAAIDHATYEGKAHAAFYAQNRSAAINLLVVCDWLYPNFVSQFTKDRAGDTSAESRLLSAVTGRDISEPELNLVGERVWNLMRAITVREGRTRAEDTLHESYFSEYRDSGAPPEPAVPRDAFERAKDEYYELRGWDPVTGRPGGEKLRELDLPDVAQTLADLGLLP